MKRRCLPWYKHYPGEQLAAAADLGLEEEGALSRMRGWSWLNGPLPSDTHEVAKLLRAPRRVTLIASLLERFFQLTEAGWIDSELEEQRANALSKSAARSQSGAAGAASRWHGKDMANVIDDKWQMPSYARSNSKISIGEGSTEEVGSSSTRARGVRMAAGGEP